MRKSIRKKPRRTPRMMVMVERIPVLAERIWDELLLTSAWCNLVPGWGDEISPSAQADYEEDLRAAIERALKEGGVR